MLGETYALLCAAAWAAAVVLLRICGYGVPPVALNLFKNTVALTLFLITLLLLGVDLVPAGVGRGDWAAVILSGVLGLGVADTLFLASLNRLGAGRNAIVDCLYSPSVVLCAYFFLNEDVSWRLVLSIGLMVGAILVGTPADARDGERQPARREVTEGVVLGALSMIFMALGVTLAKPVLAHTDVWWVTTARLAAGAVFLAIQCALRRDRREILAHFRPTRAWRFMVPASIMSSYVAMILWLSAFQHTFAGLASVLNQTSSVFVLVFAALFLGERLTRRRAAAVVLGIAGAVAAAA
ncbi:MAG: DMT family transporter [Candidatus Schekmanbacteria bacterium]|nr:DMT family transporter [Candidatus Schekmanbacteria bacterium]